MVGPAFLLMGSPGPCCTCRPTGQLVRSMRKGGVANTRFAAEPVTGSWLKALVPASRMASERMLEHFISGPRATRSMQPRYSCRFLGARASDRPFIPLSASAQKGCQRCLRMRIVRIKFAGNQAIGESRALLFPIHSPSLPRIRFRPCCAARAQPLRWPVPPSVSARKMTSASSPLPAQPWACRPSRRQVIVTRL